MFTYHIRILDRYDRDVVSLAVLADECADWRPDMDHRDRMGRSMEFRFPVVKLTDWAVRRNVLETSDNPFAVVVLAHLAAQETRGTRGEGSRSS